MNVRISVVIPVYNGDLATLRQTLDSALKSVATRTDTEILIVDNCPDANQAQKVETCVSQMAPSFKYHRNPQCLSIADNWNRCIELASGGWVHILHEDDLITPGFYDDLIDAEDRHGIEVFTCRCYTINDNEQVLSVSELIRENEGFLDDARAVFIAKNPIYCPCVAVRIDVYRRVGRFNSRLSFALDWEMWSRIAAEYRIWHTPTVRASYRVHQASQSSLLKRTSESSNDLLRAVDAIAAHSPEYARMARIYAARHIIDSAAQLATAGHPYDALRQLLVMPLRLPVMLGRWRYVDTFLVCLSVLVRATEGGVASLTTSQPTGTGSTNENPTDQGMPRS